MFRFMRIRQLLFCRRNDKQHSVFIFQQYALSLDTKSTYLNILSSAFENKFSFPSSYRISHVPFLSWMRLIHPVRDDIIRSNVQNINPAFLSISITSPCFFRMQVMMKRLVQMMLSIVSSSIGNCSARDMEMDVFKQRRFLLARSSLGNIDSDELTLSFKQTCNITFATSTTTQIQE